MCVVIKSRPEFKIGHVGSKTRSLGQFLEKPCVLSRRHSFDPVFMKLCQNDFLTLNKCLSRRAMLSDDSSCLGSKDVVLKLTLLMKESVNMTIYLVQLTLVISKLKGPSETLRDFRSSTYQIFRIEKNTNRTAKFHKSICNRLL